MKRLKLLLKFVAATLGVALAIATVFLVPTIWGKPWSYEHFTLRVLVGEFMHSPQLRGRLGVGVPFTSQSALDDLSPAAHQATMKRYDDAIAMQERYARPEGEVDALSYDVFGVFLRDTRAANGISPYTITHLLGPHVQVPEFLIQYHAVEDAESAESYLQRLSNVPGALQGAVEFARYRAESGYVAPTFILDRIVADATAFAEPTAADNPLVTEFAQKLTTSGVEDAPAYVAQAERIVEAEVYPAFAD
ncbi:MAG: DUF885 family protein, partial [Proteobacteria bacterium]|nr:DUF885 family protein [Pseudomonadota bacterium]